MSKHTPGPWSVTDRTLIQDSNGLVFVGVYEDDDDIPDWRLEADTRLIAAAPELLEALKETWRVIDAAGLLNLSNGVQLGQTSWYIKASDAETFSRAAIAKAEGRT